MAQHENSKGQTVDWQTPPFITRALPGFDLDPCASANQINPTARRMVALPDDGLAIKWTGTVWLNPPYGAREIEPWMRQMAEHNNGVALVFARVETKWFHRYVWPVASGLFFFEGRLSFIHGRSVSARQRYSGNAAAPSVLVSYGSTCREWIHEVQLPGAFVPIQPEHMEPILSLRKRQSECYAERP